MKLQVGDSPAAREAFAQAMLILNSIAGSIEEEKLREIFLNSAAVQEVVNEAARRASSQ
jgi:hypothetical protein